MENQIGSKPRKTAMGIKIGAHMVNDGVVIHEHTEYEEDELHRCQNDPAVDRHIFDNFHDHVLGSGTGVDDSEKGGRYQYPQGHPADFHGFKT